LTGNDRKSLILMAGFWAAATDPSDTIQIALPNTFRFGRCRGVLSRIAFELGATGCRTKKELLAFVAYGRGIAHPIHVHSTNRVYGITVFEKSERHDVASDFPAAQRVDCRTPSQPHVFTLKISFKSHMAMGSITEWQKSRQKFYGSRRAVNEFEQGLFAQ
jgi:hypothetical protein